MRRTLWFLFLLSACSESAVEPEVSFNQSVAHAPSVIVQVSGDPLEIARSHGITPKFIYRHALNGFAASIPDVAKAGLMKDVRVKKVELDVRVRVAEEWNRDRLDQVGYPLDGIYSPANTGSGVRAYVVDTGIRYTHADFGGRASFGWDYSGGDGSDCHGHGTSVAGLLGSSRYGIATQVLISSVRVLDCTGSNDESVIIAGLDWIAQNGVRPAVVNMSLIAPSNSLLNQAVANLSQLGFPVVVAAGNDALDACNFSPSSEPSAITVGGTWISRVFGKGRKYTDTDEKTGSSNWGNCVDVFAPGYDLRTSSFVSDTTTGYLSGTSAAAPHVSGVAAIVLSANPLFSSFQVDSAIKARSIKGVVRNSQSVNADMVYAR